MDVWKILERRKSSTTLILNSPCVENGQFIMSDSEEQSAANAGEEFKALCLKRRGRLGACTRKCNEIKHLLVENGDVDKVQLLMKDFAVCLRDFKAMHAKVQDFLDDEGKENDYSEWYEPRMTNLEYFIKDVDAWKTKQRKLEELVEVKDSVSNVSRTSVRSSSSSAKAAAAEKAALEARSKSLPALHALKMEETTLKSKMEQLELKSQMDAADAKLQVLHEDSEQQDVIVLDGMNDYHDQNMAQLNEQTLPETSAIEYAPVAAVPKKPLQKVVRHISKGEQMPTRPTSSSPHDSSIRPNTVSDLNTTMLQTQKELTELMLQQQNLSLLPQREVPVFSGDPLSYQTFTHAFKYLIEDKTSNCQDRLYFLEQFTSGQAKDLVRSCMHMNPTQGYKEAKQLLEQHFGNEMKIANAYIEKALNWTPIKPDDGKALHAYVLYLKQCLNAMNDLDHMDELNIASNLKLLLSKVPYKLRERWRTKVYESEQKKTRIKFKHLVEFLETQANILLHPIFGDIKDSVPIKHVTSRVPSPNTRKMSFAISVVSPVHKMPREPPTLLTCSFCDDAHSVIDCPQFALESQNTKVEHLKKNGHCFGCLRRGHMSKECQKRLICQTCQGKHPTVLHIDRRPADHMQQTSPQPTTSTDIHTAAPLVEQLKKEKADLQKELDDCKVKVSTLEKLIEVSTAASVTGLQTNSDESERNMDTQNEQIRAQVNELQTKLKDKEEDLKKQRMEVNEMKTKMESKEAEVQNLKQRIARVTAGLQEKLNKREEDLKRSEDQVKELKMKLSLEQKSKEENMAASRMEIERLKQENAALLTELEERLKTSAAEVERLKLEKDSAYASEYTTFMEGILDKGYAERVPASQLQRCDGRVWHIPHHGVYRKQKPTCCRDQSTSSACFLKVMKHLKPGVHAFITDKPKHSSACSHTSPYTCTHGLHNSAPHIQSLLHIHELCHIAPHVHWTLIFGTFQAF